MSKVKILDVSIDAVRLGDILRVILETITSHHRLLIAHVNITGLNIAFEQDWYRAFLNRAGLVYCDGMGVQLGARLLGKVIPERLTLADWVWSLAEMCQVSGFSIYLLGNPPGVAEHAALALQAKFPGLKISGAHHGFFDLNSEEENAALVYQINLSQPDILLVGLGMPLQEKWLDENWSSLQANVAITCGALFEYLSGELKRGPRWMTQNFLEWLARIFISPRRYGKRYLRDIPIFFYRIIRQKTT